MSVELFAFSFNSLANASDKILTPFIDSNSKTYWQPIAFHLK